MKLLKKNQITQFQNVIPHQYNFLVSFLNCRNIAEETT